MRFASFPLMSLAANDASGSQSARKSSRSSPSPTRGSRHNLKVAAKLLKVLLEPLDGVSHSNLSLRRRLAAPPPRTSTEPRSRRRTAKVRVCKSRFVLPREEEV